MSSKPCIIIGGGGHASVLCDVLLSQGREIKAVVCLERSLNRRVFSGIPHIECDEDAFKLNPNEVALINGVGSLTSSSLRGIITEKYRERGFTFDHVIANSAVISDFSILRSGVQVLHGAVVQAGSEIDEHTIINTLSSVDHDCVIGKYNHVAPRAIMCGGVVTGDDVFIGAGSTIVQGVSVGESTIIGAGAVVTKNIDQHSVVFPARSLVKGEI